MRIDRFKTLKDEELKQIDEATMILLSDVGVQIHSDSVLDILAQGGAQVDKTKRLVHFPEQLVRKALSTVPSYKDIWS